VGDIRLSQRDAPWNDSLSRVGIVAALDAEARTINPVTQPQGVPLALPDGALLIVSGIGLSAASRAAQTLVDAGATALASFGLAGGLDPQLAAGTILLASEVISLAGITLAVSAEWRLRLGSALTDAGSTTRAAVADGRLLTSSSAIAAIDAKAAAFRDTGARAVDMESLAVAQVATSYGLPFLAVRVIVDTALDALPGSVMAASESGRVRVGRLIAGLASTPTDLPSVIRLGKRYRLAIRSLQSVATLESLRQVAQ
jgi:adenosylhomocysteine nucleosidase